MHPIFSAVVLSAVSLAGALAEGAAISRQHGFGNLLRGGDGEDAVVLPDPAKVIRRNTNDAMSGEASLEIAGKGTAVFPDLIEIDRSKTYELSGYFKSAQPNQPSRVLLDLRLFTADKRRINSWAVKPVTGVSTVSFDAKTGEATLRVVKSDWPEDVRKLRLALDAREDLSDLPNFETLNMSSFRVGEKEYEITLAEPLTRDVPAGTTVRLHKYQDHPRVWSSHVPYEWTRYSFQITDKGIPGADARLYLWPGAKYAEVRVLHQYRRYPEPLPPGEAPPILRFDDISFRIMD